jgi:uncharacterized RDD family membrane protein YckC
MIKITELKEKKFRTTHKKDEFGNRVKGREDYVGLRRVRTVKSGPRFGHFIIDLIFFQIVLYVVQYLLGLLMLVVGTDNPISLTLAFVSSILVLLLYPIMYFVCEYYWQQTPGKLLTNTVVIDEYANKPDLRKLTLRSLIRLVPFEAFSCLNDYNHGWHDRWSETLVVKKEELAILKKLQQEQEK